ncbi:peptidase M24 [Umbelopsis sp. PMI_123]|nr:peptidase M24 [Umbelopsis sp. PMI_123]
MLKTVCQATLLAATRRRTVTFLQHNISHSHQQLSGTRITRALATSTNASLIPDTHQRSYGQPVFETHPYAIQKNELTPGISALEYEMRRTALMKSLEENSLVVSLGYRTRYMSNNVFYQFHQNTDFWYLTGFNEPDAAVILEKDSSPKGYKMTMFGLPKNPSIELWDGPRTGLDGIIEKFGADEAFTSMQFPSRLKEAINNAKSIYVDTNMSSGSILSSSEPAKNLISYGMATDWSNWQVGGVAGLLTKIIQSLESYGKISKPVKQLSPLVQEFRNIKSDAEAKVMRKSGEISSKAFIEAMKFTKPGITEGQLWAKLDFECRMRGSSMLAYVPVVAGGPNALSMHYVRNDMKLRDGDLVLVDCGGEYNGYASDITRTWPVNGKFSEPQKKLYQAVLNVNKACIKLCTESHNLSLHGIHDLSVRLMKQELDKINFPVKSGDVERILYPHHVGHYLGLDVHDCHDLDRSRRLKKGMVITIEPGIYVPYDNRFPEEYQGIGIRIEDNVCIGKEDPWVLTATAPKEIVDIEFCCESS